jgi:hypothetical protein
VGIRCAEHKDTLYLQKLALKFANKRRSLGWYSLLAHQSHGVSLVLEPTLYSLSTESIIEYAMKKKYLWKVFISVLWKFSCPDVYRVNQKCADKVWGWTPHTKTRKHKHGAANSLFSSYSPANLVIVLTEFVNLVALMLLVGQQKSAVGLHLTLRLSFNAVIHFTG